MEEYTHSLENAELDLFGDLPLANYSIANLLINLVSLCYLIRQLYIDSGIAALMSLSASPSLKVLLAIWLGPFDIFLVNVRSVLYHQETNMPMPQLFLGSTSL